MSLPREPRTSGFTSLQPLMNVHCMRMHILGPCDQRGCIHGLVNAKVLIGFWSRSSILLPKCERNISSNHKMIRTLDGQINVQNQSAQIRVPETFIHKDKINAPFNTSCMCKSGCITLVMFIKSLRRKHLVVAEPLMHHFTMSVFVTGLVRSNCLWDQRANARIGIHQENAWPWSQCVQQEDPAGLGSTSIGQLPHQAYMVHVQRPGSSEGHQRTTVQSTCAQTDGWCECGRCTHGGCQCDEQSVLQSIFELQSDPSARQRQKARDKTLYHDGLSSWTWFPGYLRSGCLVHKSSSWVPHDGQRQSLLVLLDWNRA